MAVLLGANLVVFGLFSVKSGSSARNTRFRTGSDSTKTKNDIVKAGVGRMARKVVNLPIKVRKDGNACAGRSPIHHDLWLDDLPFNVIGHTDTLSIACRHPELEKGIYNMFGHT